MQLNTLSHILLFTLMLLMQSATVVHSVEHNDDQHTELCSAYLSAEKVSAVEIPAPSLIDFLFQTQSIESGQIPTAKNQPFLAYASRAPPRN